MNVGLGVGLTWGSAVVTRRCYEKKRTLKQREKQQKKYFIISIFLILVSLGFIWGLKGDFALWVCGLCFYFVGFNLLEAFLMLILKLLDIPSSRWGIFFDHREVDS